MREEIDLMDPEHVAWREECEALADLAVAGNLSIEEPVERHAA